MHPKNPFFQKYDFEALIACTPALRPFVFVNQYGTQTITFGDQQAVKALNSALLKLHYNIDWKIPENSLCPPIPGRLDYLLYIADLVKKTEVRLLDIGTGSNLIYPILGICHFGWQCTGSEVDGDSLANAQQIISNNHVLKAVELRQQPFKHHILTHIIQPQDTFDAVVCNPPFFKNALDASRNNQRKVRNLQLKKQKPLNFGGRSNELWFKGGEEAFVKKMVAESIGFRTQVHWFTSLISKKENLRSIQRAVYKIGATDVKVVDMGQGNKKSRFIAWTFK